mmetsp:Transcript_4870/g.9990  ORF Transcript_4870/g.9990 Transcript_4870/m.9990 type:complete len:300 (+) Transcript_4870:38-937(+)
MTDSEVSACKQLCQDDGSLGRAGDLLEACATPGAATSHNCVPATPAELVRRSRTHLPEDGPSDAETVPGTDAATGIFTESLAVPHTRLTASRHSQTERSRKGSWCIGAGQRMGQDMEQSVLEMESFLPSQASQSETIEVNDHDTQECVCLEAGLASKTLLTQQRNGPVDVENMHEQAQLVQTAAPPIWVRETQDSILVVGDDSISEEENTDNMVRRLGQTDDSPALPSAPDFSSLLPPIGIGAQAVSRAPDAVEAVVEAAWQADVHEVAQDANDAFTLEFNRRLDFVRERDKRRRVTTF